MKVYLATSSRNKMQPVVLKLLRAAGHDVYDFLNPQKDKSAFRWEDINQDYKRSNTFVYREMLFDEKAKRHFESNLIALRGSDAVIGLEPFGVSTAIELGYAAGCGIPTAVVLSTPPSHELMLKIVDRILITSEEILDVLRDFDRGIR